MLILQQRSNDMAFASQGIGSLIVLFDRLGQVEVAATLSGALTKVSVFNPFVPDLHDVVARLRETLGDAAFDEANKSGAAMALDEATGYALDQVEQALLSCTK
jgi:hypothetical protein